MASWLNIIGLFFDIVGVIGLYYITDGFMTRISIADVKILANAFGSDPKKASNEMYESLTKRWESGEEAKKDNKKRLFFICVIIGFLFQISSSLYPFFSNKITSNESNKCATKNTGNCHNKSH
jgi:hypothetical protein